MPVATATVLVFDFSPAARSAKAAEPAPLAQRSLVASHPLVPDPALDEPGTAPALAASIATDLAAPRCQATHPSAFALALASLGRDLGAEPAIIGGAWPHCRGPRTPRSNWRLASLGPALPSPPEPGTSARNKLLGSPTTSGGNIRWNASAGCLTSRLRVVLGEVASRFGPVTVNSTCRSRTHNRRVGGAPRSYHLTGNAVDFRVRGSYGAVHAFLSRQRTVGGLKHYGSGVFHIDTGPRRTWGPRRRYAAR